MGLLLGKNKAKLAGTIRGSRRHVQAESYYNAHGICGDADECTPAARGWCIAENRDIPEWANGEVAAMEKLGLVEGKGGNAFAPGDHTTRAEAVTVLLMMPALKGK